MNISLMISAEAKALCMVLIISWQVIIPVNSTGFRHTCDCDYREEKHKSALKRIEWALWNTLSQSNYSSTALAG